MKSSILLMLLLFFGISISSVNAAESSCSENLTATLKVLYPNNNKWVADQVCYDTLKKALEGTKSCNEALNIIPHTTFLLNPKSVLNELAKGVLRLASNRDKKYLACEKVMTNTWATPIIESCTGIRDMDGIDVEYFDSSCVNSPKK